VSSISSFAHLSLYEREQIAIFKALGFSLREIGRRLGRSHSSISRELRRNNRPHPMMKGYASIQAHRQACDRKKISGKRPRLKQPAIQNFVKKMIRLGWTPEIVASQIKRVFPGYSLCHEAIYQYIYSDWQAGIRYLPRRHKQRYPRTFSRKYRVKKLFANRVNIKSRPEAANNRNEFGHWESDSIESRQSRAIINVLYERKSRFVKLSLVSDKKAACTENAIKEQLKRLPQQARQSITYDNGTENGNYEQIEKELSTQSYFCDPYKSWQKGGVENTNGLIRRWFPRGTDLAKLAPSQLNEVAFWLNTRPRKCLGFKTPLEVFLKFCGAIAC
jgi:IS30 family transposase